MSSSDLPGLEIFLRSISSELRSKSDALVALVHLSLINEGFKCIGTGEIFPDDLDHVSSSELLPDGWNSDAAYVFKYWKSSKKEQLLLKAIKSDADLMVNVLVNPGNRVFATSLSVNDFISEEYGQYSTLFLSASAKARLIAEIKREILDKINSNYSDNHTQRQEQFPYPTPEPPPASRLLEEHPRPLRHFPDIGGADLDPMGRGIGGGMLMDPNNIPDYVFPNPLGHPRNFHPRFDPSSGLDRRLPPGAVPPGARFDYIGPPRPRRPNFGPGAPHHPDLEHPPDYDDMFM